MKHFILLAALAAGIIGGSAVPSAWAGIAPGDGADRVTADMIQTGSDIPAHWHTPSVGYDYSVQDVMIPMRDGVRLHTVIMLPQGGHDRAIVFERTPYDANRFLTRSRLHGYEAVARADRDWVAAGYILVWQDLRGKYGSQGRFVMTRPPRGPLNPSQTDDTTDAWDSIEWLLKHVPQSNGRVGMIGSSYDGWAVAMALLDPHPALKVAAPESPLLDGWMGDDWYHYGAMRQVNLDFFTSQMMSSGRGEAMPRDQHDDYDNFLQAGSAGAMAERHGLGQLPWWHRFAAHPAYDAFWQGQALDVLLARHPSAVPTMWLQGLWDQEDIYGALHAWEGLVAAGYGASNHLVIGPWAHGQVNGDGSRLGPLVWPDDTSAWFRREVLRPWFDRYLRDTPMTRPLPQAMIYNPSERRWDSFEHWPIATRQALTPLYLQAGHGLGFQAPAVAGGDSYVSDPADPVPYLARPILPDDTRWRTWLLADQRFLAARTDVLSYRSPVLTHAVYLQGAPVADLFARTTGSDGDFVVKLIDVYPDPYPADPAMAGYALPIALDIFRGRYRRHFDRPAPIPANRIQEYTYRLPTVNYVFKPGHRIMVQIQSSLFPLYDRNPQTWVANILAAQPRDYRKATITIEHSPATPSALRLPLVSAPAAEP